VEKINKEKLISLLIPLVLGMLSGIISMGGMKEFNSLIKPILSPPGFLFPIVWTILYVLMGISSYLIYKENDYHSNCCLKIYGINLFMNFLWTPIFFGLNLRLFALIWIILLDVVVIYMIICFYKVNKKAAYLQIPYFIWCLFATYLNLSIYLLNR
jgi:tryptophan-rich sensory protein